VARLRRQVAAALFGAVLLVWADVVARMLVAPDELPVGVVTALLGGAFLSCWSQGAANASRGSSRRLL
jgi:ABC-type Fe3+-siderophore transport system permease subunit